MPSKETSPDDVTEQKQAVEALARVAQEWQQTFDSTLDAIWLLDRDHHIVRSNRTAQQIFGLPGSAMIGKHCWEIVHGTTQPIPECPALRARKSLCREDMPLQIGQRWFSVHVDPILDEDGNYSGAVHIVSDITERKQGEERLNKTLERLDLATSAARLGIWDWDIQKNELVWDDRMYELYGIKREDFGGAYEAWLAGIHPDDRDASNEASQQARSGETEYHTEFRVVCPDGTVRHLGAHGLVVRDSNGTPLRMTGINHDITERKRAEHLLSVQHTLSHELNTASSTEEWLELCLDAAIDISDMDCGGIYLFSEFDGCLELTVHKGLSPAFVASASHFDAQSLNGQLVFAGQPVYSEYVRLDISIDDAGRSEMLRASAVIPVACKGRIIGCFNLASHVRSNVPVFARTALETIAAQIGTGITRLKSEEALKESEERFSSLAQASFEGIAIHDKGQILDANQALANLFGYEHSELIGMNVLNLAAPESRDRVRNNFLAGYDKPYEATGLRKDGTTIVGELRGRPIMYRGQLARVTAVRDISERKQAEESLAAEKERLAVTLRSIGDGVITTDINGCIVIMNKVAEELTGWEWLEAQGKPLEAVFNIIDDITRQPCENPVTKVLSSGDNIELANHTLLITRNGVERIIADSGAPIKDGDGNTIGVVLVFRDMTEKQRLTDTIQRTAKLDSLGVLAGGIAHDFNNLLTGVFGYIDLARSVSDDAEIVEYLGAAASAINRARALTLQLLTFAKGGAPIQKVTPLVPFIPETVRFALSGSNVACRFSLPESLWACNIDKDQIGQVIDNIVINAQHAMPDGGTIEVAAENVAFGESEHPTLAKGNYVKMSIKDFGIGILASILPRVFDPFYTTKPKGHGLGLATCYSIINRHGGCIDAESEPGQGSTFHVYLPAVATLASVHDVQTAKQEGSGTIIVVDDEEVIRNTVRKMLELLGYSAACKRDGREAIDHFISETKAGRTFVAMIFDLTIPGGMGGVEAVAEIRKLDESIPVFVASGYADDTVMRSPTAYGFTSSLCKPFTIAELSEMLTGRSKS